MIAKIEALRYRCLKYTPVELRSFQILVGPNASGKSTFLDVVQLFGDLLQKGLSAVNDRSPNFKDLVWMGDGNDFELAIEAVIPKDKIGLAQNGYRKVRYEVKIGYTSEKVLAILGENLWLVAGSKTTNFVQRSLFPELLDSPEFLVWPNGKPSKNGWRKVVVKQSETGNDYFKSETTDWNNSFRLGPQKLALANLPEDESRFPIATWFKRMLMDGLQRLVLNGEAMRNPAPPGSPRQFQPDGSNLPWAIADLEEKNPKRFKQWIAHVQTALPDIKNIDTVERPEDKKRYLRVVYNTGLKAPSWTVSDGTLRLLALTLVAYLDEPGRIYLVEEPENGIHPKAAEAVFQSLSSTYESQVLCASHSPVLLSQAEPDQILCFAKKDGATDIVRGTEHPKLKNWRREIDLGTMFASGILE